MATVNVSFLNQAQALSERAIKLSTDPIGNLQALRDIRQTADALRTKISQSAVSDENQQAYALALRARNTTLISSSPRNYRLHINTMCPFAAPTLPNVGYGSNFQIPELRSYGGGSGSRAVVRLSPSCWGSIPEAVRTAVGDPRGKQVSILYLVQDARGVAWSTRPERPVVFGTHQWAHDQLLPGQDVGGGNKDRAKDVNRDRFHMGLFPICGITNQGMGGLHDRHGKPKNPTPIAFGHLSPQRVHCHPEKGGTTAAAMLYSPDNAHFLFDPRYPFSAFWSVATEPAKNRILITRILAAHISPEEDPFVKAIFDSTMDDQCISFAAHASSLQMSYQALSEELFSPILEALVTDQPDQALQLFSTLPAWHQAQIGKIARTIKHDADVNNLTAFTQLNKDQRIAAIERHREMLGMILFGEVEQLVDQSTELETPLTALGDRFNSGDPTAITAFGQLAVDQQKRITSALWRLNGYPKDGSPFAVQRFGTFPPQMQAQAAYFAAMSAPFELPAMRAPGRAPVVLLADHKQEDKEFEVDLTALQGSQSSIEATPLSQRLHDIEGFVSALGIAFQGEQLERQMQHLFNEQYRIPQAEKLAIYQILGGAGGTDQQKQERGRKIFNSNTAKVQLVLQARIKELEEAEAAAFDFEEDDDSTVSTDHKGTTPTATAAQGTTPSKASLPSIDDLHSLQAKLRADQDQILKAREKFRNARDFLKTITKDTQLQAMHDYFNKNFIRAEKLAFYVFLGGNEETGRTLFTVDLAAVKDGVRRKIEHFIQQTKELDDRLAAVQHDIAVATLD